MTGDVGADQVDVAHQDLLEACILGAAKVVPGDTGLDEGVKILGGVCEQPLVLEHSGDLAGESVGVDRLRIVEAVADALKRLNCDAQQFPGHFTGAVAGFE